MPLDAIVIGRGGGSTEDLWAFNEEAVADAIFESVVPVVSAVGHEIDVTVADLVADYRAETPSAAVVALTPDRRELMAGLLELRHAALRGGRTPVATRPAARRAARGTAGAAPAAPAGPRPGTAARRHGRTAAPGCESAADSGDEQLAALAARLETLSPLNVLTRGYSLTHTADGKLVRAADDVKPGDVLVTRVAGGAIVELRVETESRNPKHESNEDRPD